MQFTSEQLARIRATAYAAARTHTTSAARQALDAGQWRVVSLLEPDADGAPLIDSLHFRVDVEVDGEHRALSAIGWKPVGLDMTQVIAEANAVMAAHAAGERVDGPASPPIVAFEVDDVPDYPPTS